MKEAWFCPDKWTHIKIPVSAFGDFTETYGGNLNSINQVVFKFTKVFDTYELWETGKLVTPTSFDFQLDNVIATNGDAGKDNELIDYDTMMLDPYIEWDIIPSPPIPLAPTLYGDANGDCTIAIEDALLILQSSVGKITLADKTRVDVNANGTVESTDALCVLQYSIGKITSFPMAMIYNAETEKNSEVYIEEPGTHLGIVSKDASLGHPAPTEGDYSYCINTSGNQVALYYTLPKSFDATEYEYIEMDVYSEFEIVSNWSFGLATDPADAEGASWNMTAAWIPGKRWTHIKMPISAFSDFTETYGGDMGDINRIKILITNIMDGVQLVDDGYPTTPKYTYIYFDNITATKNGAGKDNDRIDVETVMIDPPVWFENYRGIICGGI